MNVRPDYPNPFWKARRALRMTHQEVANETGHTKVYVIRTEQGVYPSPSSKLIRFFIDRIEDDDIDVSYFLSEYREYQRCCRLANGPANPISILKDPMYPSYFDTLINRWDKSEANKIQHPFKFWMDDSHTNLSLMQVCKAYCISPSLIQRFMRQTYMVLTVPEPIKEALIEAGFHPELMHSLDRAYKSFRERTYTLESCNDS